jgi:hypothetical protein
MVKPTIETWQVINMSSIPDEFLNELCSIDSGGYRQYDLGTGYPLDDWLSENVEGIAPIFMLYNDLP